PAGIFQGCGFVNMQMIAYGPGAANTGEPIPRIQTKTTLMAMLSSMMGRGGRGQPAPQDGDE
ncbi:MAG: hypothetical protein HYU66_17700, partial [Armatimonadetes bacterium]|nr:hypothetical protein [Armatimonadota bacterium]